MINFLSKKNITNKICLLRVDLNEELLGTTPLRIQRASLVVKKLINYGNKVVIITSFGRPKGVFDQKFSLIKHARLLAELLSMPFSTESTGGSLVFFQEDFRGIIDKIKSTPSSSIVMLENLRFYPEEEMCDEVFAKTLAQLGDVYINDSFATCHRESASLTVLPKLLPAFAGYDLEKEIVNLSGIKNNPRHPFVGIFGGVKLSDKLACIKRLMPNMDKVLFGGGLANVLLKAKGYEVGTSVIESTAFDTAKALIHNYKDKIVLPVDVVVVDKDGGVLVKNIESVRPDDAIYDIGFQTIKKYSDIIKLARMTVWNGPLGKFEEARFSHGGRCIALALSKNAGNTNFVVAGGGETNSVLLHSKVIDTIDFVSMGGGAMLTFLADGKMPAINSLQD